QPDPVMRDNVATSSYMVPPATGCIPGTAGCPTPFPGDLRRISLLTRDLVYDRRRGKIYASVPSQGGAVPPRSGAPGNTVTVIDPITATIGPSIFVGSEPGKLALSDDGRYLYVALDGAAAVRRIDLDTQTAGLQ